MQESSQYYIYAFTPNGTRYTIAMVQIQTQPTALAFNSSGDLFVAVGGQPDDGDFQNPLPAGIYEIMPSSTVGFSTQSYFASGVVAGALAFNSSGDLFVATGGTIDEFTPNGTQSTFASFASGVRVGALSFNSSGDLFVAAANNIYEFTPNGTRSTFASGVGAYCAGVRPRASRATIPVEFPSHGKLEQFGQLDGWNTEWRRCRGCV